MRRQGRGRRKSEEEEEEFQRNGRLKFKKRGKAKAETLEGQVKTDKKELLFLKIKKSKKLTESARDCEIKGQEIES